MESSQVEFKYVNISFVGNSVVTLVNLKVLRTMYYTFFSVLHIKIRSLSVIPQSGTERFLRLVFNRIKEGNPF